MEDDFAGEPLPLTNPATVADFRDLGSKDWYYFTPKYGVQYELADGVFGYVSVFKGFRAGGFNNRAVSLASANDTPVSVRTIAGTAHTEGFEFETVVEPVDGLQWKNNASYLDTRYITFLNAGGPGVDATGNQLPFAPRGMLYSQAAYELPLHVPGAFRVGADVSFQTSYFSDVLNRPQNAIGSQAYTDAFVSYGAPGGHWLASLTAHNLADRRYFQSLSYAGSTNSWQGPVSPPRAVFFKVSYTF